MRLVLLTLATGLIVVTGCHSTAPTVHPDTVANLAPSMVNHGFWSRKELKNGTI